MVVQNFTIGDVVEYEIKNLAPFTAYKISIAAGNEHGFGKEIVASFTSSEEGESCFPVYR